MFFHAQGDLFIDFNLHNISAQRRLVYGFNMVNMYQNLTAFFSTFLGRVGNPLTMAGVMVSVIFRMLLLGFVHYFTWKEIGKNVSDKWLFFVVLTTIFAGAIPNFFIGRLAYGAGIGITVWHNPTSVVVIPFVVATFFLFVNLVKLSEVAQESRMFSLFGKTSRMFDSIYVYALLLAIALFLSVYAKVSWLVAFVPAVLLFLFVWWAVSGFGLNRLRSCIIIGCCFIPAGLLALYSRTAYFYGGADSWLVFGRNPNFILRNHITNWIFPIVVVILRRTNLKKNYLLQMAWVVLVVATLQLAFMYEEGVRFNHGNTGWGLLYARTLLVMVSMIELAHCKIVYFNDEDISSFKTKRVAINIAITLAAVHLFAGVFYTIALYTRHVYVF